MYLAVLLHVQSVQRLCLYMTGVAERLERLHGNSRKTGGTLQGHWRETGGGLQGYWRDTAGRLERDWRETSGRLEGEYREWCLESVTCQLTPRLQLADCIMVESTGE